MLIFFILLSTALTKATTRKKFPADHKENHDIHKIYKQEYKFSMTMSLNFSVAENEAKVMVDGR